MRIAGSPALVVPPHQHSPERCTPLSIAAVSTGVPQATRTGSDHDRPLSRVSQKLQHEEPDPA